MRIISQTYCSMGLLGQARPQLLKHLQKNFINKIMGKWFYNLMRVIKEVLMWSELKLKDLQVIKLCQSNNIQNS